MKKAGKASPKKKVSYPAVDKLVQFEAAWSAKQQEMVNKHNDLVSSIAAMEALVKQLAASMATEVGKLHATVEAHMQALSGLDLNILASAEVLKELTVQLTILQATVKVLNPPALYHQEKEECQAVAEAAFKTMVNSAFATVKQRLEKEAKEFRDAQQKAQETERARQAVEDELKKAHESDKTLTTSGGPGSEFPTGAEIFGG